MIQNGLLPNTIGETQGFTSYNSIDVGLLFCRTVINLRKSGYGKSDSEKKYISEVITPAVREITGAFLRGAVPGAGILSNGLISSGTPYTQLTWMDATAWGRPVTSRHGLAVDLNALWFDAMNLIKSLEKENGGRITDELEEILEGFPEAFRKMFWLDEIGSLTDTVNENGPDYKLRPNMLFATSATKGLLNDKQMKGVVASAERHLLTPLGLRTLAPDDLRFEAVYEGGPDERDSRYHQGTVWPWLIGIMVESSLNASDQPESKAEFWLEYVDNLLETHLSVNGWGFISEIFDGDNPGEGKGSFAQAWSSGEVIRARALAEKTIKGNFEEE